MGTVYHEIGTPRDCALVQTDCGRLYWGSEHEPGDWAGSVFHAALMGDVATLKRIVNSNLDVATPAGASAMHFAVAGNQLETVLFLAKRMKRPHAPDTSGTAPLALACRYGHTEVAAALIAAGALVGAVDRQGGTCLHEAALFGQRDTARMILEYVADPRMAPLLGHVLWVGNSVGYTCYDLAVGAEHSETADLIFSFMKSDCDSKPLTCLFV